MKLETHTSSKYSQASVSMSEFLLIAVPDNIITQQLRFFQQQLLKHGFTRAEVLPIRHMLLGTLMAKDFIGDTLARWFSKACLGTCCLNIDFEPVLNISQGVVSLEAKPSTELLALYKQLHVVDDFLRASDCQPLRLILHPQLPLLISQVSSFEASANGAKAPPFREQVQVKEIAMLQRNSPYETFERVNTFSLGSSF